MAATSKQRKRFRLFTQRPKADAPKPTQHPRSKPAKPSQVNRERVNRAVNGQHVEFESLAYLEYGLQWFENLIHILAPRLLIVGFVLSMVDLLTRGNLLNNGFAVYLWAIIQAMAIDATLPNMWRLSFLRFDERRWIAGGVLLIVAIALAGVVLAALSIQFLQQSAGISLDQTMARLGINVDMLSYIRSCAVVALAAILSVLNRSKIAAAKPMRVNTKPEVNNEQETKSTERDTDKHPVVNTRFVPAKQPAIQLVNTNGKPGDDKTARTKHLLLTTNLGVTDVAKQVGVSKGYVSQVKAKLNTK